MSKTWLAALAAIGVVAGATMARAGDISAKKIFIKDNSDASKRQVLVQSADGAIQFSDAVDPATNGAALHLYSATDDFCVLLPAGASWVNKKSKLWKFNDKSTKNQAQIKNGKLLVKIKSGITFTLADNGTQGPVNAEVQFGAGTRFCMRCTSSGKNNSAKKFLGKNCAAAACDTEPSSCVPALPTTSTSTTATPTTSTTSTTCGPPSGAVLKGALAPTLGRFNYNATFGLPAANAACNTNFPGTHACTIQELQAAQAACDLAGLQDINAHAVTSFWAIDASAPILSQCNDDGLGGSNLNWEYQTAHTASRGNKVPLNGNGTLGALSTGNQCNLSGMSNVGCCQ